jgi:NAD(P)-dependent dehydrogenase (short-subunit alcohol dehydrogenase family)
MTTWTTKDIPSQRGRVAVITGATGGLGYQTALALAGAGAEVILTGRNPDKGNVALANIRAVYAKAGISYEQLDLANLVSVERFAEAFKRQDSKLDILINNAGVMAPPKRYETADGFELQFGSNYLGHYALTALLLPVLKKGKEPRVVSLSSLAARFGASIHFDDLNWRRTYRAWPAYGQSKLAMLMFAFELQRRSDENGWGLRSVAAHPGVATTNLQINGPRMGTNGKASPLEKFSSLFAPLISQSASEGALPTLFAATSPDAKGGGYYGPTGFMELKGGVGDATVASKAKDLTVAKHMWSISEQLTGVVWTDIADGVAQIPALLQTIS